MAGDDGGIWVTGITAVCLKVLRLSSVDVSTAPGALINVSRKRTGAEDAKAQDLFDKERGAEHGGAADGSGLRDSLTEDEDRSTWSL